MIPVGRSFAEKVNALLLGLVLVLGSAATVRADDLKALMKPLGFSEEDVASVRAGELVSARMESATPRELAIAIALKVPIEPARLVSALARGAVLAENPKVKHFGLVPKPVGVDAFEALSLTPDQVGRWRGASPGEDINLSGDEFRVLKTALAPVGGTSARVEAVGQAVRGVLYTRMRMYQMSGLDGIAPYERSSGDLRDAAEELRIASRASQKIGLLPSAFYDVLLGYPERVPAGFEEVFFWTSEEGPDGMMLNLTHRFSVQVDGGYGTVQRQFYVSEGYNVEQAIARLIPTEGGSIVLYTNRTSTDQVDGFGGSARRSIGDHMLEGELSALMRKVMGSLSKPSAPN